MQIRKFMVFVTFALLLCAPRTARAQDDFEIYGPDDPFYVDGEIGPTPAAIRRMKSLMLEFNTFNLVDVNETCAFDQGQWPQGFQGGRASGQHGAGGTWDDPAEDGFRCSRLLEIVAAIAGLRGVVLGDFIVAYCVAAEVVEDLLPKTVEWLNKYQEQQWRRNEIDSEWSRLTKRLGTEGWDLTSWEIKYLVIQMVNQVIIIAGPGGD